MNLLKKELYVAIYGQTARFRAVKYAILLPLFGAVYYKWGWGVFWKMLLVLFVLGIAVHFFFRWKSKGWTKSWGSYKSLFKNK